MENPIKMDDLGGKPTIFGNIHFLLIFSTLSWLPFSAAHGYKQLFLYQEQLHHLRQGETPSVKVVTLED